MGDRNVIALTDLTEVDWVKSQFSEDELFAGIRAMEGQNQLMLGSDARLFRL